MRQYIFLEELKYNLKNPLIYIFAVFFALTGYFHFSNSSSSWNGIIHIGSVYRNSAYLIANMLLSMSVLGIFAIFLPMGNSILKDFRYKTYPFLFTSHLNKTEYINGRFYGSFTAVLIIFIFGLLGIYIGSLTINSRLLGEYHTMHYITPFVAYVIPNVFVLATVFFALGTLKKNSVWLYVTAIGLLIYLFILQGFVTDLIRNKETDKELFLYFLAFIDPLGGNVFRLETQEWTMAQKNSQALPITLFIVVHRAFWLLFGFLILRLTKHRFQMEEPEKSSISD